MVLTHKMISFSEIKLRLSISPRNRFNNCIYSSPVTVQIQFPRMKPNLQHMHANSYRTKSLRMHMFIKDKQFLYSLFIIVQTYKLTVNHQEILSLSVLSVQQTEIFLVNNMKYLLKNILLTNNTFNIYQVYK